MVSGDRSSMSMGGRIQKIYALNAQAWELLEEIGRAQPVADNGGPYMLPTHISIDISRVRDLLDRYKEALR